MRTVVVATLVYACSLSTLAAQQASPGHGGDRIHRDPTTYIASLENPARDAWQKPSEVVKALGLRAGDVVADIGAGSGYLRVRSGGRRTDATAPAPDLSGRRLRLEVECRPMSVSFVLPAAESRSGTGLNIFGNAVTIKVAGRDTGGTFALMHDVTPPGGGPPLHRHRTDVEVFSVLDGRFVFELDGDRHEAGPGTTVLVQPGVVHLYQNVGDHPGRMLIHIAPAGLDAFFAELDALLRASAEPDMAAIAALHDRYGMDLLGPPLSARS